MSDDPQDQPDHDDQQPVSQQHVQPESADDVPQTGEPAVDSALQGLQDLDAAPLDEHHDRLARVHEDLHQALNRE